MSLVRHRRRVIVSSLRYCLAVQEAGADLIDAIDRHPPAVIGVIAIRCSATPRTSSPAGFGQGAYHLPTALQGGLSNVLRNGDSKVDTNGNRLEVLATGPPGRDLVAET
jgi:hypothetical protein